VIDASSNEEEDAENIGFPSSEDGRNHFRTMLEKTALRLTSMDINSLVDALKEKE